MKILPFFMITITTILTERYAVIAFVTPSSSISSVATGDKTKNGNEIVVGSNIRTTTVTATTYKTALWSSSAKKTPFVIERLGVRPNDETFFDLADMCISVFFNDGKAISDATPWKSLQLQFLRTTQRADLKRRRFRDEYEPNNVMFAAYEVIAVPLEDRSAITKSQPLIIDFDNVYNLEGIDDREVKENSKNDNFFSQFFDNNNDKQNGEEQREQQRKQDYVQGDVLAFCEVTRQPYGLPSSLSKKKNINNGEEEQEAGVIERPASLTSTSSFEDIQAMEQQYTTKRPVLTNLSVVNRGRKSGIGSKLLAACESIVRDEWEDDYEIILEVEDDNELGQSFYKKRGYNVIYTDPASRRYDVDGIFLRKVRCTRQIFRKEILKNPYANDINNYGENSNEVAKNMKQTFNNVMSIFQN